MDYPQIEKIIKLKDGSRAKLRCILVNWGDRRKFEYLIDCSIAKPRKRIFVDVVSHDDYRYRSMSRKDKQKFKGEAIVNAVGLGECQLIANELWESLSPNDLNIEAR